MSKKNIYWSREEILKRNADYNIIFGERSNGKTYQIAEYGFNEYLKNGSVMAVIRRWDTDFAGANSAKTMFDSLICNGEGKNVIKIKTKGQFDGVEYYGGRYYLTSYDEESGKSKRSENAFAYGFSLNSSEHYKSASFPMIRTIFFDEFMTRGFYLNDEFVVFQNLLSTIIRDRDNVKIFMCANTVNKYGCLYFTEMGLKHIREMKQGDIDVYEFGESGLKVAVEYTGSTNKHKASNKYFAFDNPQLQMITEGSWEMAMYPHLPMKYKPKHIIFTYFIVYEGITLQCEIINVDGNVFTFIHRKTTPIKDDSDKVFQCEYDPRPNYSRKITKPVSKIDNLIVGQFARDKVFYQDNEIGEIVRNYLQWCRKN